MAEDPSFSFDTTEEGPFLSDPESKRKSLASKRLFLVLLAVCLVIVAFIVWEVVELCLGGRP